MYTFNFQLKGSPIEFNVVAEANQVNVQFEKLKTIQVNQSHQFYVETKDNAQGEIKVIATSISISGQFLFHLKINSFFYLLFNLLTLFA